MWEEICLVLISEWLDIFSKVNNIIRDILLVSVLLIVVCLMGFLIVKVDCRMRIESINFYMICLCDLGVGKLFVFYYGCV